MRFVTPKGVAGWPKLMRPDTKFKPEGEYSTKLNVPGDDEKALKLIEDLKEAFIEEFGTKNLAKAKWPYAKEDDGSITFKFKSKSKPEVLDAKGLPLDDNTRLGSGSTLKIAGNVGLNNVSGNFYVTLYISKVKVLKLVEWSSDPFDDGDEDDVVEATDGDEEMESESKEGLPKDF
jgi:hypothetical protein